MKERIMRSKTLRDLWGCHLVFSSYIILFLMLVADVVGYIITFGQRSGESLVAELGKPESGEDK